MVLTIIGLIFIAVALFSIYSFSKQNKPSVYSKELTGKILRVEEEEIEDGKHTGFLVYLMDIDHTPYEVRGKNRIELDNPRIGKISTYLVNPNDKTDFIEKRTGDLYYLQLLKKLPYIISYIFLFIGVCLLLNPIISKFLKKVGPVVFALIPLFLGAIFTKIGFMLREHAIRQKLRCNVEVDGKIVDIVKRVDHDEDGTSTTYHPVVSYEYEGVLFRNESSLGQNPTPYQIGQDLKVYVNPTDGDDFMIEKDSKGYAFLYRIFLFFGIIILVIGVFVLIAISFIPKNNVLW